MDSAAIEVGSGSEPDEWNAITKQELERSLHK